MAESITVNGVVFERVGESPVYRNGNVFLTSVIGLGWQASVKYKGGAWCDTPEAALLDLSKEANSWAPVLAELGRLAIGGKP